MARWQVLVHFTEEEKNRLADAYRYWCKKFGLGGEPRDNDGMQFVRRALPWGGSEYMLDLRKWSAYLQSASDLEGDAEDEFARHLGGCASKVLWESACHLAEELKPAMPQLSDVEWLALVARVEE